MIKKYLIIIFTVLSSFLINHSINATGLLFSKEPPQTCIDLFGEKGVIFLKYTSISFKLSIHETESFGQVFVYDNSENPFSFAFIGRNKETAAFVLNSLTEKKQFIEIPVSVEKIGPHKWMAVEVLFHLSEQNVEVIIDGKRSILQNVLLPSSSQANIIFGANPISIPEVPRMAIKDIEIRDGGGHKYFFPLSEAEGDIAHELIHKKQGKVVHPTWLINKRYYWEKVFSFSSEKAAGIAYDSLNNQLLVVENKDLKKLNLTDFTFSQDSLNIAYMPNAYSGEAIYNPEKEEVYFYNLADVSGFTEPFFSVFSTKDKNIQIDLPEFHNPLHHHAYFLNSVNGNVYICGGYGNYIYSNSLFRYDRTQKAWNRLLIKGDSIHPRMHTVAGNGPTPNTFFIYGGVGNVTGKQELGKEFYFDLYLFDSDNLTLKRLWKRNFADGYFYPTRGLYYDRKENCIYILCLNRNTSVAYLRKFDVESGEQSIVSGPLNFPSNCIFSTIYLFYSSHYKKFYAVLRNSEDEKSDSQIDIYSLSTPPITMQELNRWSVIDEVGSSQEYIYISIFVLFLIISGSYICYIIYRKKKNNLKQVINQSSNTIQNREQVIEENPINKPTVKIKSNSLFLMGDFEAYDTKGMDISHRFGPKIRQMFILVLLNSNKETGGISTNKLSVYLWPEKTIASAKNIRNVTINHLRNILSDFDKLEMVIQDGKWKIVSDGNFYCDYFEALSLSRQLVDMTIPKEKDINRFIEILQRGTLLPSFVDYEWFSIYKVSTDIHLIKAIEKVLQYFADMKEFKKVIITADILFSFDPLSEKALIFKVKALKKTGHKLHAQSIYELYRKNYADSYGEEYTPKTEIL